MTTLKVWREYDQSYELVGRLDAEAWSFAYDAEYLNRETSASISVDMPLDLDPYFDGEALTWFSALVPEGPVASALDALRVDVNTFALGDETIGALVITPEETVPGAYEHYEPVGTEYFDRLATVPVRTSAHSMARTRLSLAGAMSKVGLYRAPDGTWYEPLGCAPSTHIVKAGSEAYPNQVLNEALCMRAAGILGLAVAECSLLSTNVDIPLLVVRRFDRPFESGAKEVSALPRPIRLHQEDFCQAIGLHGRWKYEPTGKSYLELSSRLIEEYSASPIEDRQRLLEATLYSFMIGGCDNHLKNHSLIYSKDWGSIRLAPLYDITCTTIYPEVSREMGVALSDSRKIDFVRVPDIRRAGIRSGLGEETALTIYQELEQGIVGALEEARDEIAGEGYPAVVGLADLVMTDVRNRIEETRIYRTPGELLAQAQEAVRRQVFGSDASRLIQGDGNAWPKL